MRGPLEALLVAFVRSQGKRFLELKEGLHPRFEEAIRAPRRRALYVHVPFCRQLCRYCSFNRYPLEEDLARRYFEGLRRELDLYLEMGVSFGSVYVGGGTPTVLMDELAAFLEYLKARHPVEEISLETNPRDITPENLAVLKDLGVKRLSMGVQSFQDRMLEAMGRTSHTGQEAVEKVKLAQGNFETFNIDILYNFPTQTLEDLRRDIALVKELGVDQVTFYPLMPAPKKRKAIEEAFFRIDHRREREFYGVILDEILGDGYRASTVWCFSRGERMIDEYIIEYPEYVAIGSGSVGLVGRVFYANHFAVGNYLRRVREGRLPVALSKELSRKELLRYYLLTQLFGMALRRSAHRALFGGDPEGALGLEILCLRILGAIRREGDSYRVTRGGMPLISAMMREFFTGLNRLREYCMTRGI